MHQEDFSPGPTRMLDRQESLPGNFAQPSLQESPFDGVRTQIQRTSVGSRRGVESAGSPQQVGFRGMEEEIVVEGKSGDQGKANVGAMNHGEGNGPVEANNRSILSFSQLAVQQRDFVPIGVLGLRRRSVKSGDRGLQLVGAGAASPHQAHRVVE